MNVWLFHFPLKAVFGVLDIKAIFSEFVANKVACGPVFVGFRLFAEVEQEIDSLAIGVEVNAI